MQDGVPEPSPSAGAAVLAPAIYHLAIERFRGVKALSWRPSIGANVVLGGGDVGKTTILEAIGLLLSPTNPGILSDTDYYARAVDAGFVIEAVVSMPFGSAIHYQPKPSWPWEWNGVQAVVPSTEGEAAATAEPVYRLRVQGTPDLDLVYEIVQPDGTADSFPVALRRSIGLVRLSGDDRNDRDLRLVQGSALDRLLSDKTLRSRIATELAKSNVRDELTAEALKVLEDLNETFKKQSLPDGLDLAITGGPGASIASMIGLTAACEGMQLPLANWGAGTRRLSALAIAEQNQGESPITLVDEIERGLEPYRQRALMGRLQSGKSQVFITTHSPSAIAAASKASLWYVDHAGNIGPLDASKIAKHRETDPDTFLSRVAIVGEGSTEVGFVTVLLEKALGSTLHQHGIHISDGGGQEKTLGLLQALATGGVRFGGFVDDDGKHPGGWDSVAKAQGSLFFRWPSGCIEENIVAAAPDDKLEALLTDPEGEKTGMRLRTLQERLGTDEKDFVSIKTKAAEGLKKVMIEASLGRVPAVRTKEPKEYRSDAQIWFKTVQGGRELAAKVFWLGLWPTFRQQLLPFCNAVRGAVDLPDIADLHP